MKLDVPTSRSQVFTAHDTIKQSWIARNDRIAKFFSGMNDLSSATAEDFSILTTWSDGRLENKPFAWVDSNIELVFVAWIAIPIEIIAKDVASKVSFALDNAETKTIGIDKFLLYQNNPDLVFPTRVWDSICLYGCNEIELLMKETLSREIISHPASAGSFLKRLEQHKKMLKTGEWVFKWHKYKLYDLNTWVINYDPLNHNSSVKGWPLRVVQYTLALALMRYIRDTAKHPGFVAELPQNIVDRLEYLKANWLTKLNTHDIDEIKYIYAFFLNLYHELQYKYFKYQETNFVIEDEATLQDMRNMLEALKGLLKLENIFPI